VPIYDYVCGSCGHRFEVFRGINEAGPHQCPECGGPVARAFVPPTIHFKGSGWAKTDRRATSAPTRSTGASSSGASSSGAGSSGAGSSQSTSSEEPGKPAADSSGATAGGDSSHASDGGARETPASTQAER
jgi:putative FmdB family regulatory protein